MSFADGFHLLGAMAAMSAVFITALYVTGALVRLFVAIFRFIFPTKH